MFKSDRFNRSRQTGSLFMVAASVCWSFGGLCIAFIPWNAVSIIGLRALLAAAVFAVWRRSLRVRLTKGNILAAVCLAATTVLFVFANKLTTAAAAILLQFSAPIFILLIQFVCYRQRPRAGEAAAVSVTLLGMLLFFADRLEGGGTLGNLLAIASGLSFAGVFVCSRREDTDTEQSLLLGFYINAVLGTPFVLLPSLLNTAAGGTVYELFFTPVTADPKAWAAVLFLGIVQVGLAYVFFSKGIRRTPALLACLITAMEPVLNPVWTYIGTGERPTLFTLIGGAVIVLTVVIYQWWESRSQ